MIFNDIAMHELAVELKDLLSERQYCNTVQILHKIIKVSKTHEIPSLIADDSASHAAHIVLVLSSVLAILEGPDEGQLK